MRTTELLPVRPWSPVCMPELLRTSARHALSALMTSRVARVHPVTVFVCFAFFDRYVSVTWVYRGPRREAHLRCSGTASWMFLHMVLVSSAVAFVLKSP